MSRIIAAEIQEMKIYTDELMRFAWGTDASFYRMVPSKVFRTENEADVSAILTEAYRTGTPVTFRAAGTSLSGQSLTDSWLVVAGKNWEKYSVSEDGGRVTLQPGIVGAQVNRILAPYGVKFGPDPASIGSCMVGGIVMNNASGMSCGTHANSDRTMISARMVLSDGTVLDTGDPRSRSVFEASHPEFIREICAIRDAVRGDEELSELIRYKYSIKNVTGLNILPFVEHDDPFDIIAHLLVGSEGTLAFMSEATFRTVPLPAFKASAMVYFGSIVAAAEAVVAIKKLAINAAELLDYRSLQSVGDMTADTAVLIEVTGRDEAELEERKSAVEAVLAPFQPVTGVCFSSDPEVTSKYWAIRSGIFPTVGGMRAEGTTCLIEDVAFHIEDLPQATADLSALLDRHGYEDSCIYGHALEGNFHFIINQSFESEAQIQRYKDMLADVAEMVVGKYRGSLKAEHGTGRNMAPFVEYEWGSAAFAVMKRVKALFDPKGILNPGVIFNDDPECYIKNLKSMPVLLPGAGADEETLKAFKMLNKCIECGFCEVNCVSCGFSMSSRTRVALLREMAVSSPERRAELMKQYRYPGVDTCAADGLCSTSCPMHINVADMTHELRRQLINTPGRLGWSVAAKGWSLAADHFAGTKNAIRTVLGAAELGRAVLGEKAMGALCSGLHDAFGVPLWTPAMPKPYRFSGGASAAGGSVLAGGACAGGGLAASASAAAGASSASAAGQVRGKVVYFPSCFNQMMGGPKGKAALVDEMISLLDKAGYDVIFPADMKSLCCGTIWESKGMPDVADRKSAELQEALLKASEGGKYPVLCDQSPCLHRMRKKIQGVDMYEPVEFIWKFLKDRLEFVQTDEPVAIHVTCSSRLMKLEKMFVDLAGLCSSKVIVPEGVGCCGFAGDKGMNQPELNKWALRKLRDQVKDVSAGYSNSRTCEIGLKTNSGVDYMSIVYLVNEHTK